MKRSISRFQIIVAGVMAPGLLFAQTPDGASPVAQPDDSSRVLIEHGSKGFEFKTGDGRYTLQIDSRLQFRFATPSDTDPLTEEEFDAESAPTMRINRARLKVGGNAFESWFKYYWEYDLVGGNLLDFRLMVEKYPFLKLKIGQWKIHYTRERVISSGKQQTVDRSILNRVFTIDRQQGVSLFGRLEGGGPLDFSYWASVLTGMGRSGPPNDDKHLMWMFRGQWNPLGRVVAFSGSDLERHSDPAVLFAIAAVTNRSPYTRFSTSGGGQLGNLESGKPGQYRVRQLLVETAFLYHGFSWQHESHWKRVIDHLNGAEGDVAGSYFQAGIFLDGLLSSFPKQLEISGRYAFVGAENQLNDDMREEMTVAMNWFFNGHRNKLTVEGTLFDIEDPDEGSLEKWTRFRIQWDVSL